MTSPLRNFDFSLLDDPDFREDSVREEIIVPLLAALGYSAMPPHRIIRSRRLEHPYVYIGSIKQKIVIIPDYLLQRDGKNSWVLDAKAPDESIDRGKNVEQAYSYSIHKDIRVPLYALCNGRRLTIFHISHWPALIDVELAKLGSDWGRIVSLLSTRAAWPNGIPPNFRPDFGLAVKHLGIDNVKGKKVSQVFASVRVLMVAKVDDRIYSVSAYCGLPETGEFMATFDFPEPVYRQLLSTLTAESARDVSQSLKQQPFHFTVPVSEIFLLGVVAESGDEVIMNENESYSPFIARQFIGPEDRIPIQ